MHLHDRIVLYLERASLYHLARLNTRWFWLDEPLVSAFIERWHLETHTFHMPFGEYTITLQDVAYQLGLPVDGLPVFGCLTDFEKLIEEGKPVWEWFQELFGELPPQNKVKQYTVHFTWFHERFRVLSDDATEETVRIYARAYFMMLLFTQLFGDKSGNRVHIRWLPFVARLDDMGSYSWRSAALAWLYRCMCRVANINMTNLAGPLQLPQSWIFWRFPSLRARRFDTYSFPLASRWVTYLPTSDCKEERVVQCRLALDRLGDRDIVWEPYASLDVMVVVHLEILIEEHSRVAHRFLSPDSLIADPRAEEISQDVVQRGSSQAPSRVLMPDVPDNRRIERRRCVGTQATDREWRWLDDIIQDDRSYGNGVGHADHRVRHGRPQHRGGSSGVAYGGPGDRPTEQAGAETQEVPLTHVSSSQIYQEIHGQMYDDLAGLTFTMGKDHEVGSSSSILTLQISFGMTTLRIFNSRPHRIKCRRPRPRWTYVGVPPRYGGYAAVLATDVLPSWVPVPVTCTPE
ncbi:hypothetical protein Ahy_B03g063992 [Arachis hypogaea]|uniref:Aminotransferase-like plant mobile domain-containing protein n=1 Tax=Arachis hypogaea TaxID=3818 RepID=A0A444ZYF3_ARAHY|nr:hypothetical protein Ahy_B03g063992 [Arachis hypogaea]